MTEINVFNFKQKFGEIKEAIETAKFISIDLEFSALNPYITPSLFDGPKERYIKQRKNVENTIPLQIGLTTFKFDADKNSFQGTPYTFYVKPGLFSHVKRYFNFESSAIEFLSSNNFDFNKCFHSGVPYISKVQEEDLRKCLKNGEVFETNTNISGQIRDILGNVQTEVNKWYEDAGSGDILSLNDISKLYHCDLEFRFFFRRYIEGHLPNVLVFQDENQMLSLKKVEEQEMSLWRKKNDLNEEIIDSLLGFSKIYKLIVSTKKPIIAHNSLMDLLIMIINFEGSLPTTYQDFKKKATKLFPVIFDTKHIFYNLRQKLPEEKQPAGSDLKTLFHFFKDGIGRHVAMHSPGIDIIGDEVAVGKFHDAGWDSFCTGYIFIRLAYLEIYDKHPLGKIFMPTEYLSVMLQYKNCLNVIRGSVNHINLNGADPLSKRPPLFVVESYGEKKLDFIELTSALGAFGSIDVKPFSWRKNKALIAVDNYPSAKSMIREFQKSQKYKVQQYSFIKHSPIVKAAIWGGVTISGITLLLLMHIVTSR